MLLAADIGNSNITFGIFDKNKIVKIFRLESNTELSYTEYKNLIKNFCDEVKINSCIIASVVSGLDEIIKKSADGIFGVNSLILNSGLKLGIKLNVKNPKSVGADRIANACGAYILYEKPVIVIDSGSAITFDIVDKDGNFTGGLIMPGLNMQLESLHKNTSKLPKIKLRNIDSVIAKNTEEAILSGVLIGTASAIDGLIDKCEQELGQKAVIVLTGGTAEYLAKNITKKIDEINPNLTLEGLKFIYDLNREIN